MLPKIDWSNTAERKEKIIQAKKHIKSFMPKDMKSLWGNLSEAVHQKTEEIQREEKQNGTAIPILEMQDLLEQSLPADTIENFKKKGAIVVRGVIPKHQIDTWYAGLKEYLQENDYDKQKVDPNLDTYFSNLASKKPQIYNIFWSKCQMNLRQHPNLAKVKVFLNSFWTSEKNGMQYFDKNKDITYADRLRIRQPKDTSLGLSPHIDGGSVERWMDDANIKIYKKIFQGNWQEYSPFEAAYRNEVENIPSPAVCRAFRTYQGWVALSPQGPGDGSLKVIPMLKEASAYFLLRPFLEDVDDSQLSGAQPGKAQSIDSTWHQALLEALVSIPKMQPGDTVWWHSDLVHAVEDTHTGSDESSVVYIGSAPLCKRNKAFLELQKPTFLQGLSSPDFAKENREVNYTNRASLADLSDLGKKQMGFLPWD